MYLLLPCKFVMMVVITIEKVVSFWPSDVIRRHKSGSALAHVMGLWLPAPCHYLNQCWLFIDGMFWGFQLIAFQNKCSWTFPWHLFEYYCIFKDYCYISQGPMSSCDLHSVSGICTLIVFTWWRHQMETFSALLALCAGNSPVTGEFPSQRPVTRSFDVLFDLHLNKRLSKQSKGWWLGTPSCSWRHCND